MTFEPVSKLDILLHPGSPCIQHDHREPQRTAPGQIIVDEPLPRTRYFLGDFGETIPWQIGEAERFVHLIEIDQLRTAGARTGFSQSIYPHQRIQQAGFSDVAPAEKCDLSRKLQLRFGRKLVHSGCTYYKPWHGPRRALLFSRAWRLAPGALT